MDLSYTVDNATIQNDLFGLFPGAPGGRATRDRYGRLHLRDLGQRGGQSTRDRYGLDYMRKIARRGSIARCVKEDTVPRTIQHWDGSLQLKKQHNPQASSAPDAAKSPDPTTLPLTADKLVEQCCPRCGALLPQPLKRLDAIPGQAHLRRAVTVALTGRHPITFIGIGSTLADARAIGPMHLAEAVQCRARIAVPPELLEPAPPAHQNTEE